MPKKTLFIDVMCKGRFVMTFRYQYCPLFTIDLNDVRNKLLAQRPSLRGKQLELYLD